MAWLGYLLAFLSGCVATGIVWQLVGWREERRQRAKWEAHDRDFDRRLRSTRET